MTQMVLLLLGVFIPLGLILGLFLWVTSRAERERARVVEPSRIKSSVTFVGAERYMGPDESFEDSFGCGAGMLEKLAEGLRESGLETGEIVKENWCAALEVVAGTERVEVTCGFRDEEWLVGVGPVRSARVPVEDTELLRVIGSIDETLKGLEGIERIVWRGDEEV